MLRFDQLAVSCADHRHLGSAAEDLGQHAFVVGGKVGHDDKGQAVVSRRGSEELLKRFDATGRGTDAHNRNETSRL